ncbi:MAG: lipoyl(octanoyl) transferase LipB [Candidatus Binatia bacterium]
MRILLFKDLGTVDYQSTLALQEKLVAQRQAGQVADLLLTVEHPHVFTLGRAGKEQHLLDRREVPFVRTSRGGDITYHGPGQMVAYPIIDLRSTLRKAVHGYLRQIEEATIATLKKFRIRARRSPPWTGIWIENRKIASIGITVRKGVTFHGLALNVSPDLNYFKRIIPCGLSWAEVTSIEKELGRTIPLSEVKDEWVRNFVDRLGYTELKTLCPEDIQIGSRSNSPAVPITFASSEF